VSDNSKSAAMVECANPKCGRRFQAVVASLKHKKCQICGGEMKPVEPKAKEPR
jgi:hypothetical protein